MSDKERTAALYELEKKARKLGHAIGDGLPKGIGFVVWLFEWGHDGWATYISNAQRESMIEALEELLTRLRKPDGIRPPLGGFMKLICQKWEESERDPEFGVVVRPDGYSLHPHLLHLSRYVREYNDGLPTDHVPDVYSRPAGEPYKCEISNDSLIPAAIENDGHFRSHTSDYPEPIDGSKPTGWVNLPNGGQGRVMSPFEERMRDQLRKLHPNIDKRLGVAEEGPRVNRGKYIDDLLEAVMPSLTEEQKKEVVDNVLRRAAEEKEEKVAARPARADGRQGHELSDIDALIARIDGDAT